VNDAEVNVCPLTPVIVAPADATVAVVQGFERCRTPPLNVEVGEQVTPVSTNVHGTSAAAAVPARASAATAVALMVNEPLHAIFPPIRFLALPKGCPSR